MKKGKILFLTSILIVASLLLSGCLQSASTGEVTPQDNSELQTILDAVAEQTPAGDAGDGTGGSPSAVDSLQQTQTAEAAVPTPEPPPTATPTPEPTPTPKAVDKTVPEKYTLHEGEFPWCLARRFNINPTTLLNYNGLAGSEYEVGQVISIPPNPGTFGEARSLSKHPIDYTVLANETFYSIACKFGDVWPEEIAAANNMKVTDTLTAGATIHIP
ncbi:MAG: LysM peptidoglycan-binding domain-containing protein [Anaerolineales bacterium]